MSKMTKYLVSGGCNKYAEASNKGMDKQICLICSMVER